MSRCFQESRNERQQTFVTGDKKDSDKLPFLTLHFDTCNAVTLNATLITCRIVALRKRIRSKTFSSTLMLQETAHCVHWNIHNLLMENTECSLLFELLWITKLLNKSITKLLSKEVTKFLNEQTTEQLNYLNISNKQKIVFPVKSIAVEQTIFRRARPRPWSRVKFRLRVIKIPAN